MRILFLVNSFPKISETFILSQVTGMIDRGHDVRIFARRSSSEEDRHRDVERYGLMERTTTVNPPENMLYRLISAGVLIPKGILEMPRRTLESLRFRRYHREALSLRLLHYAAAFTHEDVDVLVCHFGHNGNLGAFLKRTGLDVRVVTMFHGSDVRQAKNGSKNIYEPALEESDVILGNSRKTMDELVSLGADDSKVHWHPVGVDPDMFYTPRNKESEDDAVTITTVARLVEEKDVETAIRAIAELISKAVGTDVRYRIVGDGPKRESLENLTRKLGLEDVVQFEGQVERRRVSEFLSTTDIFLLTSVEEAFGLALVEAQAAGVPVVATSVGGIPEAVAAGDSATLVPPRNPERTAEQLAHLSRQPGLRSEMGARGHRFVVENFDVDVLNDEFESLLRGTGECSHDDERIAREGGRQ